MGPSFSFVLSFGLFPEIIPLYLDSQLLYNDASSGLLSDFMNDYLGGVRGAYVLLLIYCGLVIVNLESCIFVSFMG